MTIQELSSRFESATPVVRTASQLQQEPIGIQWSGLMGAGIPLYVKALHTLCHVPFLIVAENKEKAAYWQNDIEALGGEVHCLLFPASYRRPYEIEDTDNANVLLRTEVLEKLKTAAANTIVVTYAEALAETLVTRQELDANTLSIAIGDRLSIDFVNETLFEYEFSRVDFVSEPGEFSVRGGIVDVFSFASENPFRIEFMGNEVESIRAFDIETQLSISGLQSISIVPNIAQHGWREHRVSLLQYLPDSSVLVLDNAIQSEAQIQSVYEKAQQAFDKLQGPVQRLPPDQLYVTPESWRMQCLQWRRIELGTQHSFPVAARYMFHCKPQPSFNKQFALLLSHLQENHQAGLHNVLCCTHSNQAQRFHDIFESIDQGREGVQSQEYSCLILPLSEGFIDEALQLACYTDHQIFERYHKFNIKGDASRKAQISLKELMALQVGDYVTHIDHGVGKFGGLQKIQVDGKTQEAIKLIYADNDIVYVSIHALHKIAKFNGKDGTVPKIYKLGSQAWKTLKQKTKERVKKVAFNLIQLYAQRRAMSGFACGPDSYLQKELESSFIYEDTPDQLKATQEVKADMESPRPMDRLVCGDVGFGKTEVAIRAAFKAVDNGKQVAVLVPTTILAYQHYRTFSERLKEMPVKVDYLNRFRTAKQKQEILKQLADGRLDILIGTHQLVNKNVQFKDLGLLVIDEEQKFGVNVKDKLKTIAHKVDTLTLTATPIPRTLQFSLMAARDLSVITTPPPNRYPIETRVVGFHEETLRDAIIYELQRNGQVFFIHNRIENIREVAGMLQRLVPDARIGVGHGQMEGAQLEALMLGFMNGEFDVLVATSIIESGLDVPNANTIFIHQAHQFGLSDLHQMRGRVGRSNKKAFCYFICPPYSTMTEEARKRIQALEQHSDLGSGFNIAMKDLEIRGAGDLLGAEQSGFINEIGFDTYQKIMNEAIEELKEKEFKALFHEDDETPTPYVREVQIDTDLELLFPDHYINQVRERLQLYNELNGLSDTATLQQYRQRLIDRFGPLPGAAEALLRSMELKWLAMDLGIEKIVLKQGQCLGYFIADQQSEYYQSAAFQQLLQAILAQPNRMRLKEKLTKNGLRLLLTMEHVKTVQEAVKLLETLHPSHR